MYYSILYALHSHNDPNQKDITLANCFDIYGPTLINNIDNDDIMLGIAEKVQDENIVGLIISIVEMNIEAEGVIIFNKGLYIKGEGFKDAEIAEELNRIVKVMKEKNLLEREIANFTSNDVKRLFSGIQ